MKTFIIGQSPEADIRLNDPSVSRLHAELTCTDTGRYFLTDRASRLGTHIWQDNSWRAIRQRYVTPQDRLRFGACEAILHDLLSQDIGRPSRQPL